MTTYLILAFLVIYVGSLYALWKIQPRLDAKGKKKSPVKKQYKPRKPGIKEQAVIEAAAQKKGEPAREAASAISSVSSLVPPGVARNGGIGADRDAS